MSVSAVSAPVLSSAPRIRRVGSAAGFLMPEGATVDVAAAPGVAALGLDGLLAMQEAEGNAGADRAARRHADQLMAGLAALQRALLGGGAGADAVLERLAALVRDAPQAADPRLATLVRAVAVRAAIELARRAPAAPTAAHE